MLCSYKDLFNFTFKTNKMDNTHYISTELLSLEILQEIVLHHKLWRYQKKQKLIFKMS
jgi:histidine ammonia-lyase